MVLFAMSASAATWGDYEYSVLEDNTIEITKYIGTDKEVEIPSEIDGKAVTIIGESAFSECDNLESVVLPDTVTVIEEKVFYCCRALKNLKLSNNLTRIDHYAFGCCASLTEVYLPDSLTEMDSFVFALCLNLKEVHLSENLTKLPWGTFIACVELEEVIIPENTILVEECAFSLCFALKKMTVENPEIKFDSYALLSEYGPKEGVTYDEFVEKWYKLLNAVVLDFSEEELEDIISELESVTVVDIFALPNLTIYCHAGSTAQAYAIENDINYELIASEEPEEPEIPDTPVDPEVPEVIPEETVEDNFFTRFLAFLENIFDFVLSIIHN